MSIFARAQFLTWRFVPEEGKKPRKAPNVDVTDISKQTTYEVAKATGKPVGYAFHPSDPYAFIDLDGCRDPLTGAVTPEAQEMLNYLRGAAVEVSISGKGFHIVGRVLDKALFANRKHRFGGFIEFYVQERFMALGQGFTGDFDCDLTDRLDAIVPHKPVAEAPVYAPTNDTEDDATLWSMMMNSKASAVAAFGDGATLQDLLTGNVVALAKAFPSVSDAPFDHSRADASLMARLAWWCRKDPVRMQRIFGLSALGKRDKWLERPQYRDDTTSHAVSVTTSVRDMPKAVDAVPGGEVLTITEQLEHFKGCVYVTEVHRVFVPGGFFLKPDQFRVLYGGKKFVIGESAAEKNAFTAFTENRLHTFPRVQRTIFRPTRQPGEIIGDAVNAYWPDDVPVKQGNPDRFLAFLRKLLPDDRDRRILLSYIAAVVQYPGVKFQWAPVLQGIDGNGKTLVSRVVAAAVGQKYAYFPNAANLDNPFNAWIENKIFIAVEEIHMEGRRKLLDTLKPLITNDRVENQAKGVDQRMMDNLANWLFTTNHRDAILKTDNDRRYAMFFTAQQYPEDVSHDGMGGSYFPDFYDWLKVEGYAVITQFLRTYPIEAEFNPAGECHRAPVTSTTREAVQESRGPIEQFVLEAAEGDRKGFRGGWVSSAAVTTLLREYNKWLSPNKIGEMLLGLGYQRVCRATTTILMEDSKPVLYVLKTLWREGLGQAEYMAAQGYAADVSNVVPYPVKKWV